LIPIPFVSARKIANPLTFIIKREMIAAAWREIPTIREGLKFIKQFYSEAFLQLF